MMGTGFWVIFLAAAVYSGLHSWLAALRVKAAVERRWGAAGLRGYRLFYVVVASLTLLPVMALVPLLPDRRIYAIPLPWVLLTTGLQILSALGLLAGVGQTGAVTFLGLDALLRPRQPAQPARLVTDGLYRWVRHPLYTCGLVFLWCTPVMSWNVLALVLAFSLYFVLGALLEERKLLVEFGDVYAQYRRRTPFLIPGLRFRKQ